MPTNIILLKILGTPQEQHATFYWPTALSSGLPRSSFTELAALMKLPERRLAGVLGLDAPKKKSLVLDLQTSEGVFRISQVLSELIAKTAWSTEACVKWLAQSNGLLRQRVPQELLRSGMGYEYVVAAVSRL